MLDIDEFDRKILRVLQDDNRKTNDEIGDLVGLSASAVHRRITKLRASNAILKDVSIIDPRVFDIGLVCIVDISLKEGNAFAISSFKKQMADCKEVSECYYVTGMYDFVITVHTQNIEHFEQFQREKLQENELLKHFYTHVVMEK